MVMPNLYGNIVNNVCAGLVGGPGLVAGANYGHVYAVFDTVSSQAQLCCLSLIVALCQLVYYSVVQPLVLLKG